MIRPAVAQDAARIAAAVAQQPLLVRYGVTLAGLSRDLERAIEAGEGVLLSTDVRDDVLGFAWLLAQGGFGVGGYLRLIAVAPGSESRGTGRALLAAVEAAVPTRHLFLLVSDFNRAAQRFYERAGYTQGGALPGLVLAGVDELIYWKRLR